MQHKRKKVTRKKGTENYGKGQGKKTRKSGSRGGHGMAGSGKRSEAKKMKLTGGANKFLGKYGFNSVQRKDIKVINLATIHERLDSLVAGKYVTKEGDLFVIDLQKLGFDKLLSKGTCKSKFKILVDYASGSVIEKVKQAGGEVVLLTAESSE